MLKRMKRARPLRSNMPGICSRRVKGSMVQAVSELE